VDISQYVGGGIVVFNLRSRNLRWQQHLDLSTDHTKYRAYMYSAPTLVDLNRDGKMEIVVGTSMVGLLCCALLCCAVLCCAVRCCAVLCCAVLCCAVLCCAVLCCAVLCCFGCVALCCTVLCCLPCSALCLFTSCSLTDRWSDHRQHYCIARHTVCASAMSHACILTCTLFCCMQ